MRLTLRTLLAYLDDMLEPAAAKEIGHKLVESDFARDLVSRLKEITRRRRLGAPPVTGARIDPNTIAEYLDSELTSDVVADLEKLCLESDVELAEVAACHQILTLIGHRAKVSDATRQRMCSLVRTMESVPATAHRAPEPAPAPTLPPMMPWGSFGTRTAWIAVVIVLLILLAGLVYKSLPDRRGTQLAQSPPAAPAVPAEPLDRDEVYVPGKVGAKAEPPQGPELPEPKSVVATPGERPSTAAPVLPGGKSAPSSEAPQPKPAEPSPPEPAEPKGEPNGKKPAATETKPAVKPEEAKVPETKPAPAEDTRPASPTPKAAEPRVQLGQYTSSSGVLCTPDAAGKEWRRIAPRAPVRSATWLLCLTPYRAALSLESAAAIDLVGETELQLDVPPEGQVANILFARGRLVITARNAPRDVAIRFAGQDQRWHITLKSVETLVAVEGNPQWKPGASAAYEATLYVPRGEVEVKLQAADSDSGRAEQVGGPAYLRWSSTDGYRDKATLLVVPAWIEKEDVKLQVINAAKHLESRLKPDEPTGLRLMEAAEDAELRREARALAVQALGAMGRLPALIDALGNDKFRDVRIEAITALRRYLVRGPAEAEGLAQELARKIKSRPHADAVRDLLRGFDNDTMGKKETYELLVDLLAPEVDLAVRELAIDNLQNLTGETFDYSPDHPLPGPIEQWRRAIQRGKLPPTTRGKM
jgi:hypothetical protein